MARPIRVLVVDDNESDRTLVKRALARGEEPYEVVEVLSRAELENNLAAGDFDLVISDYNILGMNGLEVLEVVKDLSPRTPLVLLTGTGSEEIAVAALKRGAADYVVKTVSHIRKLPATVAAVLERAGLARERETLQEALRASEEKYRSLVETAAEAVLGVGADGVVRFFSRGAERMFGCGGEDVVGRPVGGLAPPASREALERAVRQSLDGGGYRGGDMLATALARAGGEEFPAEISFSLLPPEAGPGITVVVRDVTEKRRLEAEVARLERQAAIGEMTAGIAHELRNPLAAITTSATMARDELAEAGLDTENADWILQGARKIEDLLKRFFDFAKPLAPELAPCDVNALVREVVAAELTKPAAANVAVQFELAEGLPPVPADSRLMSLVFANVVTNASQAMPGGGELTVRSQWEDGAQPSVVVTFTNTGEGVSPEEAERALEPFFTTKAAGVGLGLPLCLKIVKAHGGEFALAGREVGAEVSIRLPAGRP